LALGNLGAGIAGGATVFITLKAIDEFSGTFNNATKTMAGMAVVAGAAFAGTMAIMSSSIKEAAKYEAAQTRLATIVGNVNRQSIGRIEALKAEREAIVAADEANSNLAKGFSVVSTSALAAIDAELKDLEGKDATTEGIKRQIQALNDQAKALEKVGVVDKSNISIVQSQLATFDMSTDAIQRLTPSILDYVVAEKGANASTEDFRQMTNGLAQALQGNFASLTRTGFVLDDATKELIKNGTEAERTAALAKVLGSTYEGMNAAATETAEGALIILNRSLGDVKETIGTALLPILQNFIDFIQPLIERIGAWIEQHPKLATAILIGTAALSGLILVVIALSVAIGALMAVSWPVVLVILAIVAVVAAVIAIFIYWKDILMWVVGVSLDVAGWLMKIWQGFKDFWIVLWAICKNIVYGAWNDMITFIENSINWIIDKMNKVIRAMNRIPGVNIPLIPKVDMSFAKAELVDINKLISDQQANREKMVADIEAAKETISNTVKEKIGYEAKPEKSTEININGDIIGVDATDISKALSDEIGTKLSL
jgi:hypothetical protein